MGRSVYLINPRSDMPGYHGADVCRHLDLGPVAWIADIVVTTIAALVPDDFKVSVCDENLDAVDFDSPADFIGLTGKSSQVARMIELAKEFRRRGKIVLIGGPFASLSPNSVRPYCDILVRGEIEEIASQLFNDLRRGEWSSEYVGGQPDLRTSPVPRWDLYPNERAKAGCVQTSRGCPFACEFCDVIQYSGRKQRHKSVEQILAELDRLYQYGYSTVFLADDNFTVYRRRSKELLIALRDWNLRQSDGALQFSTQLSIDTGREDEILQLCAEAGMKRVFIGIETPNEESLRETKKRQNIGIDLAAQVQRFVDYGMAVTGGMIVGFDADGPDIFERQYNLAMQTPVPIYAVRALFAPEATPLHARLQESGRLVGDPDQSTFSVSGLWPTNIIPQQMTQETLFNGLRWLANRLYEPAAFAQRMHLFIDRHGTPDMPPLQFRKSNRRVDGKMMAAILDIKRLGAAESKMFSEILAAASGIPSLQWSVFSMLFQYRQIRHMYQLGQFWEPVLAELPSPVREASTLVTLNI